MEQVIAPMLIIVRVALGKAFEGDMTVTSVAQRRTIFFAREQTYSEEDGVELHGVPLNKGRPEKGEP